MKQIIFALTFIYCVFCQGPAYNVEDRVEGNCMNIGGEASDSISTSTCVDRNLYEKGYGYYDKCCYIRYRKKGRMHDRCIGLTREYYIDVVQTIENIEKGKMPERYSKLKDSKIYELNCNSSYLKLFALSFALISLLF